MDEATLRRSLHTAALAYASGVARMARGEREDPNNALWSARHTLLSSLAAVAPEISQRKCAMYHSKTTAQLVISWCAAVEYYCRFPGSPGAVWWLSVPNAVERDRAVAAVDASVPDDLRHWVMLWTHGL